MTLHKNLTFADLHPLPRYQFADLGTAEAATYSSGDESCVVRVGSAPYTYYMVARVLAGVATLTEIGGNGGPASAIATSGAPVEISGTAPVGNQYLMSTGSTSAAWADPFATPATQIATSGFPVDIDTTPPATGQVLTASDSTNAAWADPTGGPTSAILTEGGQVDIDTTAPTTGQVLTAIDSNSAEWADPTAGGPATQIATFGTPIDINGTAPSAGKILTALSATTAAWYLPDPATALAKTGGSVAISATAPSAGQVLTASGTANAAWTTPGPATVLLETGGPTNLFVGAIADGQLCLRVGSTFVGVNVLDVRAAMLAHQTVWETPNQAADGTIVPTDARMYAAYVGYLPKGYLVNGAAFYILASLAVGAGQAEVAIASTPSGPSGAVQTLTLLAKGLTEDLTTGSIIRTARNATPFAHALATHTHVWALFRCSYATTRPTLVSTYNNRAGANTCKLMYKDSVADLTTLSTISGSSIVNSAQPWLSVTSF